MVPSLYSLHASWIHDPVVSTFDCAVKKILYSLLHFIYLLSKAFWISTYLFVAHFATCFELVCYNFWKLNVGLNAYGSLNLKLLKFYEV